MRRDFDLLSGRIGVVEATALLVGNVIGISIFTLPGPLAADAGPLVAIGILVAAIPLGFGILISFQLGSAIPVAGGNYVYASRLVHPFAGFLIPWLILPGVWAGLLFIGDGFAEYVGVFLSVPDLALVYALLVPFLVLNIVGIRPLARVQLTLVVVLFASMLVFIVPGAFSITPSNYTPALPNGVAPFAIAVVSLYFPLRGFGLITALGEELTEPARNIPRVLGYSAAISLTMFVSLVAVLVGVVNWQSLAGVDAAVLVAARTFLPDPVIVAVAVGPVVGGLTSLSTTYTGFSRSLMRAARDELLPRRLADIHPEFGTPHVALLVLGIPPLVVAPVRPSPVILSIWIALAVLTAGTLKAVALWRLPAVYPDRYAEAPVTFPQGMLKTVAVLGALTSLVLVFVVATQLPQLLGVFLGHIALGYIAFRLRVRQLAGRGTDLRSTLRQLASHE
ncbi:APC family permease [Haloglomus halophilum]|uniref:APC family permease n=1 Tax=Haloglomus halophilum TaxID=2962672 RepID=UPI0020C9B53C|nr:APC family permease [Haloglomus halophilum]